MARNFFTRLIETGRFRVDDKGHALLFNEYFLLIPPSVLLTLMEALREELGVEKAEKILMEIGEAQVKFALPRYRNLGMEKVDKRRLIEFFLNFFNSFGWGKLSVSKLSFEDKKIILNIKESTLPLRYASLNKKKSETPIDFYLVGFLKRAFEVILGIELDLKETKCMAMGDHYCEFAGKPKS